MNINDSNILNILLKQNYITQEEKEKLEDAVKNGETNILEFVLSEGILTKDLFGQAIAEYYKTKYIDLEANAPSKDTILKLPETLAKRFKTILVSQDKDSVHVTTSDFSEVDNLLAELKLLFKGKKFKINYSLEKDIQNLLNLYKSPLESRFKKIISNSEKVAPIILEEIISEALDLTASDVHFEPQENSVLIRFRIDGILTEVGELSKDIFENILNKIKVQSNLRLDNHFGSQDGAIRMTIKEESFDLRISIAPTVNGQNAVIRILSKYIRDLSLTDLGLSSSDEKVLEKSYKKPYGMILTTGPTGSGKTTTLYSIIKKLQNPGVNITTIEDPVEYKIKGVNQIQVNPETDVSFAKGLRSIVRQDPNIILVGEVRDNETAEISVNAALTGHLVLTTFHANDAATAIPRLLDMGVEPFLLASTVNLIVSQRLVRRVCTNCRRSIEVKTSELEGFIPNAHKYFKENNVRLYQAKGCATCNYTGYKGRVAIFELIVVTSEMRDLILKNPSTEMVKALAEKQGAKSFFEDGIEKVQLGITTFEELFRVAPLDLNN